MTGSRFNFNGVLGHLTPLPGCDQVVVSHGLFLPPDKRGLSLAVSANRERQHYCFNEMCYDLMLCTVDLDNNAQVATLVKTGWVKVQTFVSRKTGHHIGLFTKNRY